MKHLLVATLIAAHTLAFIPTANAQSMTTGFNTSRHVCGAYTFDVTRVVDGFQINVTDHHRNRSMFYLDSFIDGKHEYDFSSVIPGCQAESLALLDHGSGRYNENLTVNLIDPTGITLQTKRLVSRETIFYNSTPTAVTTPASASSTLDALLALPAHPWEITRPGLVKKQRIAPEAPNMLNDNSYYVFNNTGGITRKMTDSTWHTTLATNSIICDGVSYVVYQKKYASQDTATSTFPAEQYVIERTTPTSHAFIPVPWKDGDWRASYDSTASYFRECFGKNAALDISFARMTMITPTTRFADYLNPRTSIYAQNRNVTYYQGGSIWLDWDAAGNKIVKGDATLHILNADGTVTDRKPVFFRDIRQYTDPTSMEFHLDLTDRNLIDVTLGQNHPLNKYESTTLQERNGTYTQIEHDPYRWSDAYPYRFNAGPTALNVSAEKDMLTVKSYYLPSMMLLHNLPNTSYTLLWNRVGPLEQDGTRKIWYAFKTNGVTQTWQATVR